MKQGRTVFLIASALAAGMVVDLSLGASSAAASSAGDGHQAEVAKAKKKSKKKRKPLPPPRLWYRVSLIANASTYRPDTASGSIDVVERWKLESNTAVRLKLLCTHRQLLDEPFMVDLKRKGKKKRKIAGCDPRYRKSRNLKPTLVFAANAGGEIQSWTRIDEVSAMGTCDPWTEESKLVQTVGLLGRISTPDLFKKGLSFSSRVMGPVHPESVTRIRESFTCYTPAGEPYTVDGVEGTRPFGYSFDHFGWEPVIDGESVLGQLTARPPVNRFGKSFTLDLGTVDQEFDLSRPQSESSGQASLEKVYSYKLRMKPCPRKGRDVKNC